MSEEAAAVPAMDPQTGENPDRSTPSGDQYEELARQYSEAVYDGNAEAPSILQRMVDHAVANGKSFDRDAFRQQVKEDVLADQRRSKIVKATNGLIDAHPELNERDTRFDPRMYTAVDDETSVVERQHPDWEPEQVVQEAYNRVQKWRGGHKTSTMKDKQKEKQSMSRPRASTQRYAKPPPPRNQRPPTTLPGYARSEGWSLETCFRETFIK